MAEPSTAFGTEGYPQVTMVSTQNIPSNKTVTFTSADALIFIVSINGAFVGEFVSPDGAGPYTATGNIIPNPYPTTADVDVYDKCTFVHLGGQPIRLFGGDVFNVRITYKTYIPIAHGYASVLMNGQRILMSGEEYSTLPWRSDDVVPRGSGDG